MRHHAVVIVPIRQHNERATFEGKRTLAPSRGHSMRWDPTRTKSSRPSLISTRGVEGAALSVACHMIRPSGHPTPAFHVFQPEADSLQTASCPLRAVSQVVTFCDLPARGSFRQKQLMPWSSRSEQGCFARVPFVMSGTCWSRPRIMRRRDIQCKVTRR